MLLGRRVKLVFDLLVAGTEQAMEREGTIVAVRDRAFEDCSIHVKFKSELSKESLDGIG